MSINTMQAHDRNDHNLNGITRDRNNTTLTAGHKTGHVMGSSRDYSRLKSYASWSLWYLFDTSIVLRQA